MMSINSLLKVSQCKLCQGRICLTNARQISSMLKVKHYMLFYIMCHNIMDHFHLSYAIFVSHTVSPCIIARTYQMVVYPDLSHFYQNYRGNTTSDVISQYLLQLI